MNGIIKKYSAIIISLVMIVAVFSPLSTLENVNAETETAIEGEDIVSYPVTGGNLYFDRAIGAITDCDDNVSVVQIPKEIEGIKVTSIGERAFSDCYNLLEVAFPNSIDAIGAYAFAHCRSLSKLILPENIKTIGKSAFLNCDSLRSVRIPATLTDLGESALRINSLENIYVDSENPNFASADGVLFDKTMHHLIIYPSSNIRTEYEIPKQVTDIEKDAFAFCKNLQKVTLPKDMTVISECAFNQCDSLEAITIVDSITNIEPFAFAECDNLKVMTIPKSVTNIGKNAFSGCGSLTKIEIPNGVMSIEPFLFSNCYELKDIILPDNLNAIGERAFSDCQKLDDLKIPGSVEIIGERAFEFCLALQTIEIPENTKIIASSAFRHCKALTEIKVAWNNSKYMDENGVLFNKQKNQLLTYPAGKKQRHYTVPASVTNISEESFIDCDYLKDVMLSDNMKDIADRTFYESENLSSIVIPVNITNIGREVFDGSYNLNIYGERGSYAETYAIENNIPFKSIEEYVGTYSVTFSPAGGTVDVTTKDVTSKETYGELPVPKREGYIFDGWYTEREGGMRITSETIVNLTDNQTLYAHWNKEAIDIGELTYSSIPAKVYTGKPQTPLPVLKDGNYVLQKGKDYTISYENNINAGTAKIIFTGIGSYSGTVIKNFTIKKAEQMIHTKACIKTYGNKPFSLGAKAKTKLSYKSSNTKVVAIGNTGRVTLKGPGKATITITAAATANYNGATKHVTITVKPKKTVGLKVKKGKNRMTVSWKRDKKATGYQIAYAQIKRFKKGKKNITISKNKTVKKTIKKLKARKTYYVKVRAYKKVGKTKIYGAYSKMKTIKVK